MVTELISTKFVLHTFMPGHTIEAIIKKVNMHSVDPNEMELLLSAFHELNAREVPKAGTVSKIPVLLRWEAMI